MSTTDGSKSSIDLPETDSFGHDANSNDAKSTQRPDGKSAAQKPRAPQTRPQQPAAKRAAPQAIPKAKSGPAAPNQAPGKQTPGPTAPATLKPGMPPARPSASAPQPPDNPESHHPEDEEHPDEFVSALGGWLATVPAWLVSMVFHVAMLLILALLTLQTANDIETEISLHQGDDPTKLESTEDDVPTLEDSNTDEPLEPVEVEATFDTVTPTELQDPTLAASNIPLPQFETDATAFSDPSALFSPTSGTALEGRGSGKVGLLREGGGTPESEEAVKRALQWLSNHQYPDGSWSFDHQHAQRCNSRCSAPGNIGTRQPDSPNAATALGLLPFLGAGFTHDKGQYRGVVDKGLKYLLSTQKPNGSWHDQTGTMYAHGLCAITLCEAYAMSQDPNLREPAQKAIDFIEYAQDKTGGGWRYFPGDRGDTSVVGWQVMALKSAQMAYLRVDPKTIVRAEQFLDSVSRQSGSFYGYQQPGATKTLTSVGLLCRMYMGWQQDQPALARGVQYLSETGPDMLSNDVYYNYYATQVMRHYDGPMWTKWNQQLREHLIKTQEVRDHARGSWYSDGSYNKTGGRHYTTAMSCMILEVYYRHMPLYKKSSNLGFDVGDAFKQDEDKDNDDDAGKGDAGKDAAQAGDGQQADGGV